MQWQGTVIRNHRSISQSRPVLETEQTTLLPYHWKMNEKGETKKLRLRRSSPVRATQVFFCWRLLGLIPGGTPFSQQNKGVRDAMSATTKRDVKHQVFAKTCKGPRVPTKSKQKAKNAEPVRATQDAPFFLFYLMPCALQAQMLIKTSCGRSTILRLWENR